MVHPYDARVMHHFHQDHDGVIGLHDPFEIVVEHREHRRTGGRTETHQTALGMRPLFGMIVGTWRIKVIVEPPGSARIWPKESGQASQLRLGLWSHRRTSTVRRVDDDRGTILPVNLKPRFPEVHPERIVATDVAGRTA